MKKFQPGERVICKSQPFKGCIGRYEGRTKLPPRSHKVFINGGPLFSGPRIVKVMRLERY